MVNTPIPGNLKSEAKKAAKIIRDFTVPTAKMGPDKLIPAGIFMKAKGLAILTVVKAGFLVTARGGSGIVIAKIGDGINSRWSAPTAIGIAGLGGGFEIGAEVTDFVIILNKRSAVDAFSKGGNLTLGGNFTIAAGPIGRNLEADVAVRGQAAIYTYSKTKGLFAGISIEGSGLIERKDANKKFYGRDIRAHEILKGDVEPPEGCECLYEVLEHHKKVAQGEMVKMAKREALKKASEHNKGLTNKFTAFAGSFKSGKSKSKSKGSESQGQDHFYDEDSDSPDYSPPPKRQGTRHVTKHVTKTSSTTVTKSRSSLSAGSSKGSPSLSSSSFMSSASSSNRRSAGNLQTKSASLRVRSSSGVSLKSTESSDDSWELRVTAIHPYTGTIPCDLTFKAGEEIVVLTRTDTKDDWWEGKCRGKTGIFPANYVRLNT